MTPEEQDAIIEDLLDDDTINKRIVNPVRPEKPHDTQEKPVEPEGETADKEEEPVEQKSDNQQKRDEL